MKKNSFERTLSDGYKRKKVYPLIKFQNKRHYLEDLQKGTIFCKKIDFYRDIENKDMVFYDRNEGMSANLDIKNCKVRINGRNLDPNGISSIQVSICSTQNLGIYAFCLYLVQMELSDDPPSRDNLFKSYQSMKIDRKMEEFGSHALIIENPLTFLERVNIACRKSNICFEKGHIEYRDFTESVGSVPEKHVGFIKDSQFSYQKEFRILFQKPEKDADRDQNFTLNIGSIEDISTLCTFAEIQDLIRIQRSGKSIPLNGSDHDIYKFIDATSGM